MNSNNLTMIDQKKQGTYLWKIEGENAELYLNGTVHIVPKNFFPLKDEIMDSFNKCKNLIVEVNLNLNNIQITDDIINNKYYTYQEGDSLYNHFPKKHVIRLRKYLANNNLCSPAIEKKFYKLKPFAIQALLYDGILKKANLDQEHIGLDLFFIKKATEMKKNIIELETKEFQEDLLSKLFNNKKIDKAKKTNISSESHKSSKNTNSDTINIFNRGMYFKLKRLGAVSLILEIFSKYAVKQYSMESKLKKDRTKMGVKGDLLLGNRDEKMFKKIEALLKNNDSYFVAVGASHLLGEGSIIDKLEKKGYKVTRIC